MTPSITLSTQGFDFNSSLNIDLFNKAFELSSTDVLEHFLEMFLEKEKILFFTKKGIKKEFFFDSSDFNKALEESNKD